MSGVENIYPRIAFDKDRRRVLTEREILEMRQLRNEGYASRRIAQMYAISKTAVLYHTGNDEYRERVNKKRYELLKAQEKRDILFKKKRKIQKKENAKDLLKRDEAKRKYKGKATYKWKKKKYHSNKDFADKTKQQSLKNYHKKKTINQ